MSQLMHDVAKVANVRPRHRSVVRRVSSILLPLVLLFGLIAGLRGAGVAMNLTVIIVFAAIAIGSAVVSVRWFRQGRTTAGALIAVLCLFSILVGIKVS